MAALPDRRPVAASRRMPAGRSVTLNRNGFCPLAAIVNRNGALGRAPKILALLMRGFGETGGVRMSSEACASPGRGSAAEIPESRPKNISAASRTYLRMYLNISLLRIHRIASRRQWNEFSSDIRRELVP